MRRSSLTKSSLYILVIINLLATSADIVWFLYFRSAGFVDYFGKVIITSFLLATFAAAVVICLKTIRNTGSFEKILQEKQDFLNLIINNIPIAVFAKDVKHGYRWNLWNKAATDLLELTAEEAIGRVDYDLFPKSEADFFRATDERVMAGRELVDIPEELVTTKSRGTWLSHTKKVPIYDEMGNPSILLGICEDITEKKKTEDKLRDYEAVIKYSNDAILITTAELEEPGPQILYVNNAFTKITGYKIFERYKEHGLEALPNQGIFHGQVLDLLEKCWREVGFVLAEAGFASSAFNYRRCSAICLSSKSEMATDATIGWRESKMRRAA
jgi:PAS domain S-box-containing protein